MRKEVPFAILVVVTLIVVAEFFFKIPAVTTAANEFKTWGIIIAAFALGLASINLGRVHLTRAAQKRKDWPFSVILLVSMAVFALAAVYRVRSL